ncbi:RagB/SusD family nutrient uptake outer membrane protein, partial [Barnesiella sp.]|uniref:RagB/SusD family nutrient uptake outer membrane protein n=1 Tax=Barnesiella sp. TaxID=2033407 RepID=UPI002586167E
TLSSCEDFALGDKFLQKPPSNDITIDTIFSTAEMARRVLWNSYDYLPYGYSTGNFFTAMKKGNIEGLTDLNQGYCNDSGELQIYYPGKYTADVENSNKSGTISMNNISKFRFKEFGSWSGIRHAWLFYENVDRVPDMSAEEKSRMKAEAKILVAIFYANMFRHYGGLPLIDHSLRADELNFPARATVQETVDFIVRLLDDAVACPDLPWVLPEGEQDNWYGRVTKASAMGLKVRVLLFAASPLFNDTKPYYPGEASDKHLTWYGDRQDSRWQAVADAALAFFKTVKSQGYYRLVEKGDTQKGTSRAAFRDAYYKRGTTETLIASFRNIRTANQNSLLVQSIRWGGFGPTKECFDMFPMADGTEFSWDNEEQAKNPFTNRDPRLYETIYIDGDDFKGKPIQLFQENPADKVNYPKGANFGVYPIDASSINTGLTSFKFGFDRDGGEFKGRVIQWPHLRLAEIYLSYAEALNELGRAKVKDELGMDAFDYVDVVRNRVELGDLDKNMGKEDFRELILRERAC